MKARPPWFDGELLDAAKKIRPMLMRLCKGVDAADDLIQEAFLRAIAAHESFAPGSSMSRWLYTIARNEHLSRWRLRRREVEDPNHYISGSMPVSGGQEASYDLQQAMIEIGKLPRQMRAPIRMIVIDGCSYEEVALKLGIPVGTVKSELSRAREILLDEDLAEFRAAQFELDLRQPPNQARQSAWAN